MDKIKLSFKDDTTNELTLFEHKKSDAPLFMVFPALGVRASYYIPFLEQLHQVGFHASVIDWRGNGASNVRPARTVNFGYKELVEDIHEVIMHLSFRFPTSKKVLLGHSLGGQLGSLYMAKHPNQIDGLILIASCSVYYKGWKGFAAARLYGVTYLFNVMGFLFGKFSGHRIGFGGTEARNVMKDWGNNARTGKYILLNDDFDYELALQQLEKPVLAITIKGDTFAPVEATRNLYQKYTPTSVVQHEVISGNEKLNHFNWVKYSKNVINLIKKWIEVV